MKNWAEFVDEKGFIGHKQDDGSLEFGDGTARLGAFYIYRYPIGKDLKAKLDLCRIPSSSIGIWEYTRHWDRSEWWGQGQIMSRDNLIPIWIAATLYRTEHAEEISFLLKIRSGFCWNEKHIWPKPTDRKKIPDYINVFFRKMMETRRAVAETEYARTTWLWLYDLETLISTVITVLKSRKNPENTSDDINLQLILIFAQIVHPTWPIRLAKWLYINYRQAPPSPAGTPITVRFQPMQEFGINVTPVAQAVLNSYYGNEYAPPMYDVAQPCIERYLT